MKPMLRKLIKCLTIFVFFHFNRNVVCFSNESGVVSASENEQEIKISSTEPDYFNQTSLNVSTKDIFRRQSTNQTGELSKPSEKLPLSNLTASGILMQKIKQSKNVHGKNLAGLSSNQVYSFKKQRFLKDESKFSDQGIKRLDSYQVKSQDPSSAPPLLAATSLLLLNENRESDRNKKRVVNDLSSRIKHFRENKLKQSMKSSISDFVVLDEEKTSRVENQTEFKMLSEHSNGSRTTSDKDNESNTESTLDFETLTFQPFISLQKLYMDQFIGSETLQNKKTARRVSSSEEYPLFKELETDLKIHNETSTSVVNEQELTTITVTDLYLDDIIIAGVEEALGKSVPFDTKLRYKVPEEEDSDTEMPTNLFRHTLIDNSSGTIHTRVETKDPSGSIQGYYDIQDKECKVRRLHYKADTMQGFRALKVESKNCETSGRQPKLHDGSEQISTPFVENNNGSIDGSISKMLANQSKSAEKDDDEYDILDEEVVDPDGAILQEATISNTKILPFATPQGIFESPVISQNDDGTSKRKAEGSSLFHPAYPTPAQYPHLQYQSINNQPWVNPTGNPHQLFGFPVPTQKTLHPDLISKPQIVYTTQLPNYHKNTSTSVIPHHTLNTPVPTVTQIDDEGSYDPFEFHSVHKPSAGDATKRPPPTTTKSPNTSTPRIITTQSTKKETLTVPPPTRISTSISAQEELQNTTETSIKVTEQTDIEKIPSIEEVDAEEEDETDDKDFESSANKDDDFTLKRLRQNRQESIALNGISITPLSLLPNPNNQVKPSSKPSMADIQAKLSQYSTLPELKRVAKSSPFTTEFEEGVTVEGDETFSSLTRNMLMNIILRPGGGDKTKALPRPKVDVKSEGNNVIIVKMTFPSNENIQGLKAFAPTETDDLLKFDSVHDAIGKTANIEKIHVSTIPNSPELDRKERQINLEDNFHSSPIDSGRQNVLEGYVVTTQPPSGTSHSLVTPVPIASSPTPHFIETASFPLEYFTQNEVISPKRDQFSRIYDPKSNYFLTSGNGHLVRPFHQSPKFEFQQQSYLNSLSASLKRKRNTPLNRPQSAIGLKPFPFTSLVYPGIL